MRPEHLRLERAGSPSGGILAPLDLVEPMAAELYLSLRAAMVFAAPLLYLLGTSEYDVLRPSAASFTVPAF